MAKESEVEETAFKQFQNELARTNVISESFKNTLYLLMSAACGEAFARGEKEGRRTAVLKMEEELHGKKRAR